MTTGYDPFFLAGIVILAVFTVLCLIRAILGPKLADRIMAVNMIATMTIAMIALLSVLLDETFVLDVALIYAVISFVAVIVLVKIYIGIYRERKHDLGQQPASPNPKGKETAE